MAQFKLKPEPQEPEMITFFNFFTWHKFPFPLPAHELKSSGNSIPDLVRDSKAIIVLPWSYVLLLCTIKSSLSYTVATL